MPVVWVPVKTQIRVFVPESGEPEDVFDAAVEKFKNMNQSELNRAMQAGFDLDDEYITNIDVADFVDDVD